MWLDVAFDLQLSQGHLIHFSQLKKKKNGIVLREQIKEQNKHTNIKNIIS